jgi:hypothetical protein
MLNVFVTLAAFLGLLSGQAASPVQHGYTFNLYQTRAVRFQNPDMTACVSAATMTTLNTVYYTPTTSSAVKANRLTMTWRATIRPRDQRLIERWARAHMTMLTEKPGSDVHGLRNALNYYGWGNMRAGAYADYAYGTLNGALKAIVREIALANEPVVILTQNGRHLMVITGYSVTGSDPRIGSNDFKVSGLWATDPLRERHIADTYLDYYNLKSGQKEIRFTPYLLYDSILKDPIDGRIGRNEWVHHFVFVGPVLRS